MYDKRKYQTYVLYIRIEKSFWRQLYTFILLLAEKYRQRPWLHFTFYHTRCAFFEIMLFAAGAISIIVRIVGIRACNLVTTTGGKKGKSPPEKKESPK